MVYRYKLYVIFIFLSFCFFSIVDARKHKRHTAQKLPTSESDLQRKQKQQKQENEQKQAVEKKKRHIVRVLLRSWSDGQPISSRLESTSGFWLIDPENRSRWLSYTMRDISIDMRDMFLRLNGKKVFRDHFYLIPKEGYITYNGKPYQGAFLLVHDKKTVLLINCIDLEDYICSVLSTESWPGWPLEVNKVFAVASRSYVIAMMQKNKNDFYHVRNTSLDQTYSGVHAHQILHKAVEQTVGQFLTYKDKPIIAMFDSCCGGIIPANIADFDFEKAPYLARTYPCTHCKRCKIYQWSSEYEKDNLEKIFKKAVPNLRLKNLSITKKDKAGLVQEVTVNPGSHTISGKKIYSLLNGVKSSFYTIKKNKTKFIFAGKGFGHHIGLCQWGAREMVRDGWDFKRILRFYYPGTKLVHIT